MDWAPVFGFGAFAAVGALLLARRPDNAVSWIMAAIGLIVGIFPMLETYAAYVMTTRGQPNALAVFGAWANSIYWMPLLAMAIIYLPMLFPDGRLISRRWLLPAAIAGISLAGMAAISAVSEILVGQEVDYQIPNPIGIAGIQPFEENSLSVWLLVGFFIGLLGAFASVAVRFRRSAGVERQQLKWLLFAAALGPLMLITDFFYPRAGDVMFGLVLIGIPSSVAIAILRHRLFDIDIIIRRTLQYTLLTALLALAFFGGVVLLQGLLGPMTGGAGSPLVTVLTTLAVAALFNPLRRQVQAFIDRRFFRQKYNAERTLDGFAAVARDEVDIEVLAMALLESVNGSMQPKHASIWLGAGVQER